MFHPSLLLYCLFIVLASLAGGWLPSKIKLTHLRMQVILSLVSGVMLGVATMHLIPHAINSLPNTELALGVVLFGILFMFFLNRMFHFHHHDIAEEDDDHDHETGICTHTSEKTNADISWFGLFFGMAVHTIIDGIALGAVVAIEGGAGLSLAGFTVFLAIVLHKPLDAMSITSLMAARGWSESRRTTVNLVFSLMCPIGAVLFVYGIGQFLEVRMMALGLAMAFSAGVFLCISLGDLLPEVHFHTHDRVKLSGSLMLGIAIAVGMEFLPGHGHEPVKTPEKIETGIFQRTIENDGREIRYTISISESYSPDKPSPLVVVLHYGGKVTPYYGGPILRRLVVPALEELNAIVISPDSIGGDWSTAENEFAVLQLIDEIKSELNVDTSKILITGFSMGGTGTWYLASRHQDLFSAAIPIAGRPIANVEWKIPLYVIHSEIDEVVPIKPTREYVAELKTKGVDVTFAPVEELTHRMTMRYEKPLREGVPWIKKVWGIRNDSP